MARPTIVATITTLSALSAVALLAVTGVLRAERGVPGTAHAPPQQAPCALDGISWSDPQRVSLPGRLSEVSGLEVSASGDLLAHDDERAIITRIDAESGEPVGQFKLGPGLPRDDFEGIAVLDDRLYLVTSNGRLYESPVGEDGQTVAYRVHDTGLGRRCEVEGLVADPGSRSLLLSCKTPRARELRGQVSIYAWSVDRTELDSARIRVPVAAIAAEKGKPFRPSAVERLPDGRFLIVSGADRAIAVVGPPDVVQCTRRLDSRHRQAEGVARLSDGTLVIADEGNPARLTFYHPASR